MKNPITPEQEGKILKHVTDFKQDILTANVRLRKVWLELYKNYRLFKSEDKKDWQAKLWIPKTFTVIEQIASRTTAHNPKFELIALQASALEFFTTNQAAIDEAIASEEAAKVDISKVPKERPEPNVINSKDVLNAYLTYVFRERKLKGKIRLWDKGRLTYGTYHVKIDPGVITRKRKYENSDEEKQEDIEVEEDVFSNILPDINTIDVFDLLIHPLETDLDSAYGIIHHRDEVDFNELDDETYFNLSELKTLLNGSSVSSEVPEKTTKDNRIAQNSTKKINKRGFSTDEYWGRFSLTGELEDEKEYIMTVADNKKVIRFEENKWEDPTGCYVRPFVAMHDQPVPGEYYAIGEAEPIMSLQEEINHLRNTRMDFNNSNLFPEWIVKKGSSINPFQLVHKPNNIIMADDPNDLRTVEKPQIPQSGYQEEDIINRDIQDVSATTNYSQPGASSAYTDTVSGASMRTQEQSTRMRLKIEYLDDAVAELGRKILLIASHEIQGNISIPNNKDEDSFIHIYKEAFQKMARNFSPQVITGSMAADTPSEKRNEAIARGNISMQYAQAGVPVNLPNEYKNIMEAGFNVKDIDSLMGDTTKQPVLDENGQPAPGAGSTPPPQEGAQVQPNPEAMNEAPPPGMPVTPQ